MPAPFALRVLAPGLLLALCCSACDRESKPAEPAPTDTVTARGDLSEERARTVLAKVGDRSITLGDYVSALERMDTFDRLRYQTPERRKLLLDEMIEVELLAREAERQGLDKSPETEAYLSQLMREELLRQLRDRQPRPEQIPEGEVRAHYDAHLADFADPERRRVAVIALPTTQAAREVLELVKSGDPRRWGEVARERSLLPSVPKGTPEGARPPLELEGDLGLTAQAGEARGQNPDIPAEVRDAVFRIEAPGGIFGEPVAAGGRHYVVRLVSMSPARTRTFEEAETVIRVKLAEERVKRAEAELVRELQKQYPIRIDEAAISRLSLPPPGPGRSTVEPPPVGTTRGTDGAVSSRPLAPTTAVTGSAP